MSSDKSFAANGNVNRLRQMETALYTLYIAAGISYILDGTVARKTGIVSEYGSKRDTVSDFVFISRQKSVFISRQKRFLTEQEHSYIILPHKDKGVLEDIPRRFFLFFIIIRTDILCIRFL